MKAMEVKVKQLSIEEFLNKIIPYLKHIISDFKKSDSWKTYLAIAINFISSKDTDEECVMHSKSDNIEITINDKADKVTEERFQSLPSGYQIGSETSMKGSEFVFDCYEINMHMSRNKSKSRRIIYR